MKRTGIDHPKMRHLADLLSIPVSHAIGIMECIWHFTAKHAPRGDIGKWSDRAIADAAHWPANEAERLVQALVLSCMVDAHNVARLVVHDWSEHCDDAVHMLLARKRELFANGKQPNLGRIPKSERRKILSDYADKPHKKRSARAQETHKKRTRNALPEPEPEPEPEPCRSQSLSPSLAGAGAKSLPAGAGRDPAAGVFTNVTTETLRGDNTLEDWYRRASAHKKPVVRASEQNRLRVFACAERALLESENPPRLFAWLVGGKHWDYITAEHEDRAQKRIRALSRSPPRDAAEMSLVTELANQLGRKMQV